MNIRYETLAIDNGAPELLYIFLTHSTLFEAQGVVCTRGVETATRRKSSVCMNVGMSVRRREYNLLQVSPDVRHRDGGT